MVTSRVKLGAKSVLFSALAAQAVLLSSCDRGGRFKSSILSMKASSDPVVERISPTQEISNDDRPVFKISNLKPGAVVTLHTDENCAGPAIKGAVSESDSLIMTVNLDSERGYKFRARSVDKLAKVTCSSETSPYLLDQTPPESPKLFLEDPKSSPNLDASPKFKVSDVTEADHITLYAAPRGTEARCTPDREVAVKKVTETSNGSNPSIEIESQALAPGHYFFYVTSTDPAGNDSLCPSTADEGIAYTVALQPGIPSLTLVNPAQSPSNISTPRFKVGNLTSGDNVKLFSQPDCRKELRSEDTSNSDTLELTSAALEADGSFFYSVLVTNFTGASVCQKLGFPYVFDRTPPGRLALTLLTGTNGAGSDPRPRVRVTGVEDGNTVTLYSSAGPIAAGCDSANLRATAVARGTSIDLSPNSDLIDGTYTLYVRAVDSAQNTTVCPGPTIQYTLRSIVTPREPTLRLISPARSPSNQSSPVLEVGELQALDSIELFSRSQCKGPAILSGVAAGQTLRLTPGPLTAGSYQFSVRISNSTGGTLCGRASIDYLLDLTPPTKLSNLELIKPKTSPARDPEPIIQALISDTRDTLSVHTGTPCTAQNKIDSKLLALNTSTQTVQFQLKLSEGSYTFYVGAEDSAGNAACSTESIAYRLDLTAPSAPSLVELKDPAKSPGSVSTPTFSVSEVSVTDTVTLHTDAQCLTQARATGVVSTETSIDLTLKAPLSPGSYQFYAKAMDSAGNTSECSRSYAKYTYGELPTLVYQKAPYVIQTGEALAIKPVNLTGVPVECSLLGILPLPEGLELDTDSCVVSGTPTSSTLGASVSYPVIARNQFGSSEPASFILQVIANPPSEASIALYSPSSSPSNVSTPEFKVGDLKNGLLVSLHATKDCSDQPLVEQIATESNLLLKSKTLKQNGTYIFRARAKDQQSGVSTCSSSFVEYTLDTTAPRAPYDLKLIKPKVSPSNLQEPIVQASVESIKDSFSIHTASGCLDKSLIASLQPALNEDQSTVQFQLKLEEGGYTFFVKATDLAGNSSCSSEYVKYSLDKTPPTAPLEVFLIDPATSPGDIASPSFAITGVTAGDLVSLHTDSTCSSLSIKASGIVAGGNATKLTLQEALKPGTYDFYAKATDPVGNASACSKTFAKYEYGAAPTLVYAKVPYSISVGQSLEIKPLTLTGTPVTCELVGIMGLPTGMRLDPATCVVSGTPTEGSGATVSYNVTASNVYGKSPLASFTLQVISKPPIEPSIALSSPDRSPANIATPQFKVGNLTKGLSVTLHVTKDCSDKALASATAEDSGVLLQSAALTQDGKYAFRAMATDSVSSLSTCSSSVAEYSLDKTPPTAPLEVFLIDPATSPGNIATPSFAITGVTAGDLVSLHTDSTCSSLSIKASGIVAGGNATKLTLQEALKPGTYDFYAKATDPVGNTSTCSTAYARYEYRMGPTLAYAQGTYFGRVGLEMALKPTALSGSSVICSIDDTILPDGLSLNPQTCSVSGTPSKAHEFQSHSVLAQDNWGKASASFGLVISGCEGDLDGDNSVGAADLGLLLSQYGPVTDQNRALDFDGSGEIDTGELGNLLASYGSCDRLPPTLEYESGTHFARAGAELTIKPKVLSGKSVTCGVEERTLPEGLTLDLQTCVVSGKTEKPITKTQYTVSAKNDYGTASTTFDLVVGACIGDLDGDADVDSADHGLLLGQFGPVSNRNATLDLDQSGTIDNGDLQQLLLNYGRCGSSSSPTLEYAKNVHFVVLGVETTIKPTVLTGGDVTCASDGATLPEGLKLDPKNCVISGVAKNSQPTTSYSIIARNAHGSSATAMLQLVIDVCLGDLNGDGVITQEDRERFSFLWENGEMEVDLNQDGAITREDADRFEEIIALGKCSVPSLQYPRVAFSYEVGGKVSIKPLTLGGGPVHCQLVESTGPGSSLPAGLLLDPSTCGVSGRPTAPAARASYSVLATHLTGASTQAQFSLEIRAGSLVPVVDSQADASITGSGVSPTSSTVTPEKN